MSWDLNEDLFPFSFHSSLISALCFELWNNIMLLLVMHVGERFPCKNAIEPTSLLFPTVRSPQNCGSYCLCLGELISMQSGQMALLYTERNGIYEHFFTDYSWFISSCHFDALFCFSLPLCCRELSNCTKRMFFLDKPGLWEEWEALNLSLAQPPLLTIMAAFLWQFMQRYGSVIKLGQYP